MRTFSEAIKVCDGVFYNPGGHQARVSRTAMHFFSRNIKLDLTPEMIPPNLCAGLVKCRVVYGRQGVESVEFAPYTFRTIRSVAIVHDNTIDYTYKSTDRNRLNALLTASGCDEIIIVKNGLITDTSSANLVLEDASGALYTPSTPLLAGTKRALLLERGVITEHEIRPEDLISAVKIHLINAMIDLEDGIALPRICIGAGVSNPAKPRTVFPII